MEIVQKFRPVQPSLMSSIRKVEEQDWIAIRTICCLTANVGKPIEESRWPFFAELWIGPYQKFLKDWTFVLVKESRVIGYLTGCSNTSHFNSAKLWKFTVPLFFKTLFRIVIGSYPFNGDVKRFLKRTVRLDHWPEELFSETAKEVLKSEYKAHLHINLLEEARGSGGGRMLMEHYFSKLKDNGVKGVHLYCGEGPMTFYRKLGFEELERIEFRPGAPVFALVKKL